MFENLENIIKYHFKNQSLLRQALTHSSHSIKIGENYERLEFLGDRVLGLSIAALLYRAFPEEPEGSLSPRFVRLVCRETVADMARRLQLDKYMIVGAEEIRHNEHILCDVCEALIGAIFIDSDCETAVEFVNKHWKEIIDKNIAPPKDAKTKLQEVASAKNLGLPQYKVESREGSEHEPIFHVSVRLNRGEPTFGHGRNKKLAEQEAASLMLERIEHD